MSRIDAEEYTHPPAKIRKAPCENLQTYCKQHFAKGPKSLCIPYILAASPKTSNTLTLNLRTVLAGLLAKLLKFVVVGELGCCV